MKSEIKLQRVWLIICSFLTIIVFQLKLDLIESADLNNLSFLLEFMKSFQEYNIIFVFFIPIIYHFYKYVNRKIKKSYLLYCGIPSVLFSFFMVMGYSYDKLGNWDLVINRNNFQWIKALIVFAGYIVFFFFCICYIYYIIDMCNIHFEYKKKSKINIVSKYLQLLKNRPFITTFITLFLFYIPYIIVSYPAIFGHDMVSQITSSYPELGIYSPRYTSLFNHQEGIYLNNHHPIVHTLFIHVCLEIGENLFSSYNIGIFICALIQMLFMLIIIAIVIQLMVELGISIKYICLIVIYYAASPRIQSYMFFITKDVIFAAFTLLYIVCMFQIIRDYSKKHYILLVVSMLGVMLFRNDGRYLLMLSFLIFSVLCINIRKRMILCFASVALFGIIYSNILLPALHIMPGSIKEVLSVPFQQTARYLIYSTDPITQEEKNTISTILDYDLIIEKYNPETSDNVKDTYNVLATKEELIQYFKIYIQMFFKHPSHYIQATMNNYYYYFYPGPRMAGYYNYDYSDSIMDIANDRFGVLGMKFECPNVFSEWRNMYEKLREGIANIPVISTLISSATYSWILILLVFYCLKEKNNKALAITIPLCVQLLISLAGPCNGWYFRYVYPIAICLPVVIFLSIHFIKTDTMKA